MTTLPAHPPKRRLLGWLILAAAALLVVGWNRVPLGDAADRLARLPAASSGLAVRNIPLSDAERSALGPAHVVRRRYSSASGSFVVTIIDGTANRHALHDPAFCLRGAGWQVLTDAPATTARGPARRLTLTRGDESQELLTWYSDGRSTFARPAEAWIRTALRRLSFGHSGSPVIAVIVQFARESPPDPEFLAQLETL